MRISVTKKHIRKGKRGQEGGCPIALAIREIGFTGVSVYNERCYYDSDTWRSFNLPLSARNFVKRFDGLRAVKPFRFNAPIRRLKEDKTP